MAQGLPKVAHRSDGWSNRELQAQGRSPARPNEGFSEHEDEGLGSSDRPAVPAWTLLSEREETHFLIVALCFLTVHGLGLNHKES